MRKVRKAKRPAHRPTKYSDQRVNRILSAIRQGCTRESAALLGGVSLSLFHQWCQKRPEFALAVARADAHFEAKCISQIRKAGTQPRNWTSLAFLLERKYPERFGKIDRHLIAAKGLGERPTDQALVEALAKATGITGELVPIGRLNEPRQTVEADVVTDAAFVPEDDPTPVEVQPAAPQEHQPDNPVVIHKPGLPAVSQNGMGVALRRPNRARVIPPGEWGN
jgi:hypothetical protein